MVSIMRKRGVLYGVATNDADYQVNGASFKCPFYAKWVGMLERCYSKPFLKRWPTYAGCYVCEEWLTFSSFKAWMINQDWKGKQLDKDIIREGNKVYCPDACAFVSPEVNYFVRDSYGSRGEYPIGVSWHKVNRKFAAQCKNPVTKKGECIGFFACPNKAHQAWRDRKNEHALILALTCQDERIARALVSRYA